MTHYTTQAEVSCAIADLEHIGSSDSLLAVPAYLFDDVVGPTAFLIGELWARVWDDPLADEVR